MKIYLIDTSVHTPKGRSLGIWSFHDYMYNGVTARVRRPISLYGDNREPLNVIKNIYNFADLIWVDYNVVVKEELVDIIKPKFNNIDFLKVEFSSFFNYPFTIGDDSHKNPLLADAEKFVKRVKKIPASSVYNSDYYELILPRYADIVDRFDNTRPYSISIDYTEEHDRCEFRFSESMFYEYPVFNYGKTICNEDFYYFIRDFLDPDYFWVKEYDLSEGPNPTAKMVL